MRYRFFLPLALFAFLVSGYSFAATVDTVLTRSQAMKKDIKAVVIKPSSYNNQLRFPVVYLLHGYSGNHADWISKVPHIREEADRYNLIIVCPDGGFSSWYWDSPIDPSFQYETYISSELVSYIDKQYKTIASPEGRAITGLSMGGHGALYLAIRHPDVYGAAGSMSGGVDIRPFPFNWDMAIRLGSYAANRQVWEERTVINMLHLIEPHRLALIIDCGRDDFFFAVNENLHRELMYRNIKHDYIVRPGVHNWEYWSEAVRYQLLFMHRFFETAKQKQAK
jgi:S-formylglutathione hydrolase FrmB